MSREEKAIISSSRMTGVEAVLVFLGACLGFRIVMALRLRKLKRMKESKK